ncbi:MAG: hypothetical protein GXO76_02200 [Calditrichaeota bacterium]|nr:hypothetical protein [Calditrichota bacterium]
MKIAFDSYIEKLEDKIAMRKIKLPFLLVLLVFGLLLSTSYAKDNTGQTNGSLQLAKIAGEPLHTLLNINKIAHWIQADGISAHDPYTNGSGVYFPRGTYGAGVIYTDGLVWGGYVQDGQQPSLRVGGTTYTTGLIQGAILSPGTAENANAPDVRIWRIRPDYRTADLRQDAAEYFEKSLNEISSSDVEVVRKQYETDWEEWPWQKGAPFYDTGYVNANGDTVGANNGVLDWGEDTNHNGYLDPGEDANGNGVLDAEKPGLAGADQVIWFVANDLNEGRTLGLYGSPPIGLELQVTLWGYNRTDALGNVVFKKFRLIYKGTAATSPDAYIDSMYVAQWSDPDLGEYSDDFVGCDTTLSLSFVYNSSTVDVKFRDYGLAPPSAGYDFLQGPIVKSDNPDDQAIFNGKIRKGYKNLPMTAFNYFAAGSAISDPDREEYAGTLQWFNLMRGLLPRKGTPFTKNDGVTPTKFTLAGDPVTGEGDVDGVLLPPGDRRMQMISGPFKMAVGDTQEVVVALVTGLGADRLSSISVLKFNDISAQYAYDNFFNLPKAPKNPDVKVSDMDKAVILNWGENAQAIEATEGQNEKGYKFEGYNVYQLPSAQATMDQGIRIATYDKVDEVTTIMDAQFDPASGQILMKPVQLGKNTGIKRMIKITKDAFTGKPLVNGTDYFFAVTAYNYNGSPDVPIHSLESSLNILRAVPQSPKPGVRYESSLGDTLEVTHDGASDGSVIAYVIDPTQTTGDEYKVTFTADTSGNVTWNLIDVTTGEVKLENQTNQSGDDNYVMVDGLMVKVMGPAKGFHGIWQVHNANGPIPGCDVNPNEDIMWIHWLNAPGYPTQQKQGGWVFVTHGGGTPNSEASFIARVLRGTNASRAIPYDFEMRWTAEGGKAYMGYTTGSVVHVGFELWNIGSNTWDDPSDDYRMIPWIYDVDGDDQFSFFGDDPSSSGNNDPASDWIYWRNPKDMSPGTAGYDAWASSEDAGKIGDEVLARTRLMNWNRYLGDGDAFKYGSLDSATATKQRPEVGTVLRWITNKPNTPKDVFTFKSKGVLKSERLAKTDIEKINVYPNPYYGYNPRELSTEDRFVSFNHLPQKATFRIFNLAGIMVRQLEKNDDSQFFRWDLKNDNELPVASGIYLIHIDMPELGKTKILKLAIVREAQFIQVY